MESLGKDEMEEWRYGGRKGGRRGEEEQDWSIKPEGMGLRRKREIKGKYGCKSREDGTMEKIKKRGDGWTERDHVVHMTGRWGKNGERAWAVCVWRPGQCDGRYLHSAWSSQMVYLSKASRPGLGPP